ncbi:MAG: asparagine synthase (glutamine-hydrolyzing) [Pseudomonadota bacterium]
MCGLAGVIRLVADAPPVTEPFVQQMRDSMSHRGPDGAGLWIDHNGHIGLGHRRLAIVDLSEDGAQPMASADGRFHLTYNGEIYNHLELREELVALGHQFKSHHSDTEVIIHAFRQWGIECIHRFRGMFAFALWDSIERQLWLVRDRIGVKPLYYAAHNGRLLFASEIKAILSDPSFPRAVDEGALFDYLSFLTTPPPQTLFAGVKKLAGGCLLRVDPSGAVEERRWWDALDADRDLPDREEDIAAEVLSILREAVVLRKMSDVPAGVFLSGGIDSSTNAKLFSEGDGDPVKTFSIGFDQEYESYPSELPFARMIAKEVGADHHEHLLSRNDLIEILPTMIAHQDEPIADPVCVPLFYVSKLARDNNVIVAQVGEGADELFWGYAGWKRAWRLQRLHDRLPVPGLLQDCALWALRCAGKDKGQAYDWFLRARRGKPIFWGGAEAFTHAEKTKLLSPRLREDFRARSSWSAIEPIRQRYLAKAREKSTLGWMTYLDLNLRLPELLLMRVDKMSMAVSLEARVPFLDHRFVELALAIPERLKTKGKISKYLLKKAVRGLIPDMLIDRKKQGFGLPIQEWLLEGLGDEVNHAVERFLDHTDLLDRAEVKNLLVTQKGRSQGWFIINLALWWCHYIDPKRSDQQSHATSTVSHSASTESHSISPEKGLVA